MNIKVMQVGQLGTNCYLLEDENTHTAAVVDPGGEGARILAQLKADGMELKLILLTHAHFDHTGGVAELHKALPDVPVYTLFQGSMGRIDFEGGSYEDIMASLKRLAHLPGNYQVLPGHMDTSTLDRERKTNYYIREALEG